MTAVIPQNMDTNFIMEDDDEGIVVQEENESYLSIDLSLYLIGHFLTDQPIRTHN